MNTTSKSGSTTSSWEESLNLRRHGMSDEDGRRRRRVGTIAGVAVAAGLALPSVLGGMNLGNHNETLLSAAGDVEPHTRRAPR